MTIASQREKVREKKKRDGRHKCRDSNTRRGIWLAFSFVVTVTVSIDIMKKKRKEKEKLLKHD